jgi:hypothetical protein
MSVNAKLASDARACFEFRGAPLVDTPDPRRYDLKQMAVWIAEVERFAPIFPRFPHLYSDALICQPVLPGSEIRTSYPERDVDCASRVVVGRSAFLEQQQHTPITRTHRA